MDDEIKGRKPFMVGSVELTLILAVVLTVTFWASAFAGIRAGLKSYSPENVALLRYLTASALLAVYAFIRRMPLPALKDIPALAALGFLGFALYNVTLNAGEQKIPAGMASLIVASSPIFVALISGIFFGEKLRLQTWAGIFLSFIGVAVISIEPGQVFTLSFSAVLVLIAALAQALYTSGQKPLLARYTPLQFTSYAIWAGTIFLLIYAPGLLAQVKAATPDATLAVIYMGIFPGAVWYVCWSYVVSKMPASRAGSFVYLVPAMAILIAWVWLGEVPTITAILGGVLILGGVIIVSLRGRR